VTVQLGGEVKRRKDYGNLVTAIINPSHRLAMGYDASMVANEGKSRMTVDNDVMTVSQLVDIVAFLQSYYELQPYEPTPYRDYYLPRNLDRQTNSDTKRTLPTHLNTTKWIYCESALI
jgi:hypothetical protein